jgi:hypothetical protein
VTDWYIDEDERLLVIEAEVENLGDGPSGATVVRATSEDADWGGEEDVSGLDSGESREVSIQLRIGDDVADQTHHFLVAVDPEDDIEELDEENNWDSLEVEVPPRPPEPPDHDEDDNDQTTVILLIALGATVGAAVTVAGVTLTVRHTSVGPRKDWQEKAEEDQPPETCTPCTRYCRKIEIELKPARRKITHLTLASHDPASGEKSGERQVKGEVVDRLNEAVRARRRRQEPEKLHRLVAPVASTLLQQIAEWLQGERKPREVFIAGHLAGGKVTFQFILYHCRRRGSVNVWEEEAKWKATVDDERDEPVTTLRGPEPAERVAAELTQQLMQFIDEV